MIRPIARGLAGLNAGYEGIVGLLLLASPTAGGAVYQLTALSPVSRALSRILGGLMVGNALVLALFSRRPETHPSLAPLLAAGCAVNIAADVSACLAEEIHWRQVAGSLAFQFALGATLLLSNRDFGNGPVPPGGCAEASNQARHAPSSEAVTGENWT
jgi:hypothetical protein